MFGSKQPCVLRGCRTDPEACLDGGRLLPYACNFDPTAEFLLIEECDFDSWQDVLDATSCSYDPDATLSNTRL